MSPAEARRERRAAWGCLALLIVALAAWWYGYVRPRDAYLRAVIAECPNVDRATFTACSARVRERLVHPE